MKLNVYSVYDCKACVFANPFFMVNDKSALRGFGDAVNSRDSIFAQHPEDYSLYRLGTFDDGVGLLVAEAQPVVLAMASAMVVVHPGKVVEPELVADKTHIVAQSAEKGGK